MQILIYGGAALVIALAAFFLRKYRKVLFLTDEKYKFWDILIKTGSAVLTVGTIIISARTFLNNQSESLRQREREYRKEIATRQLNYYTEISDAAGDFLVLAAYPDSLFTPSYYNKKKLFERLYYGKMNLVESEEVDEKIHDFSVALERFESGVDEVDIHELRKAAFELNNACRKSIRFTWGVELDSLNHLTK